MFTITAYTTLKSTALVYGVPVKSIVFDEQQTESDLKEMFNANTTVTQSYVSKIAYERNFTRIEYKSLVTTALTVYEQNEKDALNKALTQLTRQSIDLQCTDWTLIVQK